MYLPIISKTNPEFLTIRGANNEITSMRIDDISFIRMQENKKIRGYFVLIIMFNREIKERVEFFKSHRDANDALNAFASIIGDEFIVTFDSNNSVKEKCLVVKDDIVNATIAESNSKFNKIVHIGMVGMMRPQNEKFETESDALEFVEKLLSQ